MQPRGSARRSAPARFEPQYIVNNAGFGLVGRAADLDRDEQLGMIDLNMRTLTDLSLSFVDSLARHRGGILNVASIAGVMPGPRSAVYYASKAFVLSFTEALHDELAPRGIRVTCLCPGPVASEFQARAGIAEAEPPWPIAVPAARVAAEGLPRPDARRRIVVPGWGSKLLFALMPRIVPRPLLLARLEGRQAGRKGLPASPEPAAYRSRAHGLAIAHQPDRKWLARRLLVLWNDFLAA
jgi:short-subunit dehydrogenase